MRAIFSLMAFKLVSIRVSVSWFAWISAAVFDESWRISSIALALYSILIDIAEKAHVTVAPYNIAVSNTDAVVPLIFMAS